MGGRCSRRPSPRRVPLPGVEQVLPRYREPHGIFSGRHFREPRRTVHQIAVRYISMMIGLQTEGYVPQRPLPSTL